MKDEACGSEVWGFGLGVIGRVETPALPVLAMAEWLHGARGNLTALSLPIDMTKTWNTEIDSTVCLCASAPMPDQKCLGWSRELNLVACQPGQVPVPPDADHAEQETYGDSTDGDGRSRKL